MQSEPRHPGGEMIRFSCRFARFKDWSEAQMGSSVAPLDGWEATVRRWSVCEPKATPAAKFIEWLVLSAADIRALLLLEMSRIRKISISPRPRTVRSPHAAQDLRRFDLIGIAIDQAQAQYSMGAMLDGAK